MNFFKILIILFLTINLTACGPAFILVKLADKAVCHAVIDDEFQDEEC